MRFRGQIWILLPLLMIPFIFAAAKGDAAKGKALYRRCAVCHGDMGEGKEAVAKAYGVRIHALGSKDVQALDDAALKKVISEGKGKMQKVSLSEEEMDDVIAFVRSLSKPFPKQELRKGTAR